MYKLAIEFIILENREIIILLPTLLLTYDVIGVGNKVGNKNKGGQI